MPYIFDETGIEWPDDPDFEPPAPVPADFRYYAPQEFFGGRPPVRFREPGTASTPGFLSRLLGRGKEPPETGEAYDKALLAALLPGLRRAGVASMRFRYDGGNDEGFSWFDHATAQDGARLDADALCDLLLADGHTVDALAAFQGRSVERADLRDLLDHGMGTHWAVLLLGGGFGTGEYLMYGSFTVDLDTRVIADDPHADPVVENIEIGPADRAG